MIKKWDAEKKEKAKTLASSPRKVLGVNKPALAERVGGGGVPLDFPGGTGSHQ